MILIRNTAPNHRTRAKSCMHPSSQEVASDLFSRSMFWLLAGVGTLLGKSQQRRILKSQSLRTFTPALCIYYPDLSCQPYQALLSGSGPRKASSGVKGETGSDPHYETVFSFLNCAEVTYRQCYSLAAGNKRAQWAASITITITGRGGQESSARLAPPSSAFTMLVREFC